MGEGRQEGEIMLQQYSTTPGGQGVFSSYRINHTGPMGKIEDRQSKTQRDGGSHV